MSKTPQDLQQRVVGAYLGLAIGDALGATTEFLTPREIEHKYGCHRDIIGGGWLHLKPGLVTDDTEMSLALGQSIIDNQGVKADAVAQAFSDWMRTKPVDIGNTVRRGIIHYRNSGNPHVKVNEYDAGNGACMRSLPIAIFYHNSALESMRQASQNQAHTTHNNFISDAGTETIIEMLMAAFSSHDKHNLKIISEQLVTQHPIYRYDKRRVENPSGWIVETLQSVFQAFFAHDSFEEILIDVVNRGGDSDTTGAIAGMLAGAFYKVSNIPQFWQKKLNQNIKRQCEEQALQLLSMTQ